LDFEDGLDAILYGKEVTKIGKWGEPHKTRIFIDTENFKELKWVSKAKTGQKSKIDLKNIKGFSFGFRTPLISSQAEKFPFKEFEAFTIIYQEGNEDEAVFSCIFNKVKDLQAFAVGLQYYTLCEKCNLFLRYT
jgi:hypothetical protein